MSDIAAMRAMAGEITAAFGVPVRISRRFKQSAGRRQDGFNVETGFSESLPAGSFETVMIMPAPDVAVAFGAGDETTGRGTIEVGAATSGDYFGPRKDDVITLLDGRRAGDELPIKRVEQRLLGEALEIDFALASGKPATPGAGSSEV